MINNNSNLLLKEVLNHNEFANGIVEFVKDVLTIDETRNRLVHQENYSDEMYYPYMDYYLRFLTDISKKYRKCPFDDNMYAAFCF